MQKWEEVHSDTRFSLALGLLERALRPETELDPNLSLLGRVGLEKLGVRHLGLFCSRARTSAAV